MRQKGFCSFAAAISKAAINSALDPAVRGHSVTNAQWQWGDQLTIIRFDGVRLPGAGMRSRSNSAIRLQCGNFDIFVSGRTAHLFHEICFHGQRLRGRCDPLMCCLERRPWVASFDPRLICSAVQSPGNTRRFSPTLLKISSRSRKWDALDRRSAGCAPN